MADENGFWILEKKKKPKIDQGWRMTQESACCVSVRASAWTLSTHGAFLGNLRGAKVPEPLSVHPV